MTKSQFAPVVKVERGEADHGVVTIPPPPQHRVDLNVVTNKISNTNTTTDYVTDLEHGHVATTAVGGGGGDEADTTSPPQQHQRNSQSSSRVHSFARSFMSTNNQDGLMVRDKFPLNGSVYSLIAITPVFSWAFMVASYWIILKFALFTMLFPDAISGLFKVADVRIIAARFLLIPVMVGMQGNLIHAVSYFARTKYDPNMTQIAANATRLKYNLSLVLELMDGTLSLFFNAMVILTTNQMLNIFINFASLFFLQDIDRIGYELIEAGFFGRTMELWCHVIDRIELPRRNSAHGKVIERVTTSLFFGTVLLLLFFYSLVVWTIYGFSPNTCIFKNCPPGDLPQGTINTDSNS